MFLFLLSAVLPLPMPFRDGGRAEADGDGLDAKEPPGGLAKVISVDKSAVIDVDFLLLLLHLLLVISQPPMLAFCCCCCCCLR